MTTKAIKRAHEKAAEARAAIGHVLHGYPEAVDLLLIALATGGHALLEGVPGVGKTTLAKTFAHVTGLEFRRVQLTPDLMPTDITGHSYFDQPSASFKLRQGPVFSNILLADEINRAPPRTQSALLEVMEERQVTIDGQTLRLPDPFLVLATKNPIDIEGVYPLPEAQLDRFMLFIEMGYPDRSIERRMLEGKLDGGARAEPVQGLVAALREAIADIRVHPDVLDYVLEIVRATRGRPDLIELGAGPRASEHMLAASRAHALLAGRAFVIPDDVKAIAPHVLAHRLILTADADIAGTSKAAIVADILRDTPVPVEAAKAP